jgi:tRNA(Ile)-lysidine synthetase-like protein
MDTIWKFWASNPKFWIPVTVEEKAAADKTIFASFYNYGSLNEENAIGQIIYYDQFFRHFQRILPADTINEADIMKYRRKAEEILSSSWTSIKESADPDLIVWALMPLKHLEKWDLLFECLHEYGHSTGLWAKFYQDSYRKAYNEEKIASKIITDHSSVLGLYNYDIICDYHPSLLDRRHGLPIQGSEPDAAVKQLAKTFAAFPKDQPLTVSLSGGVDSMVMVTLLKHAGYKVNAIHIVYGNRAESAQEYAFIASFCAVLDIPLKVYKIEWLRRDTSEREFYEEMTRQIRFMVYKVAASGQPILLGHISEDVIENIWTNIASVQHLHNLKKMSATEEQLGVTLIRPFLEQEKETIYAAAASLAIPYLKNTTPSWSNRGKFREHFHDALVRQYGPEVDKKIIQFAETIAKQSETIDRILFQPMYNTWDDAIKTLNIWPAVSAQLDVMGWSSVFEFICHKKLGINKPSGRCIAEFVERLRRIPGTMRIGKDGVLVHCKSEPIYMHMHKGLQIKIDDTIMTFIV